MNLSKKQTGATERSRTVQGIVAAWPICLGYVPIGFAFGVLARKAGLGPIDIALMSIFVFAGSAQFIAVSMISSGAGAASIIATTLMVNLRHVLMSSSLAVMLKHADRLQLTVFAYGVTDESFAVNLMKFRTREWGLYRALVVNQTANGVWIISTVAGGFGGQFVPDNAFGIDFALLAMFICLLVFQLRGRKYIVTAVIAGVTAVIISLMMPGNSYIVMATVFAATVGVMIENRGRQRQKEAETE
jgi:4-azaleucine resistance transporter AzlC